MVTCANCPYECLTCELSSSTWGVPVCTACQVGYVQTKTGFMIPDGKECIKCRVANCWTCHPRDLNICLKCVPNHGENDGQCLSAGENCPTGKFMDKTYKDP